MKVDRDAPLRLLGPLGCGVQTGVGAVMNALRPQAGSTIAIFGAGTVGLSAAIAAALCGCATVIAVDSLTLSGTCGVIEGDSVPGEFIPRLIDLYRQGRFPFDKLVTEFKFGEVQKAVTESERGTVVKAVLRMSGF